MTSLEDKERRIAYIVQKKISLKRAIDKVRDYLKTSSPDFVGAQFRLDRVNTLFTEYGRYNDELMRLDSKHPDLELFDEIELEYFDVGSAVKRLHNPNPIASSTLNSSNITFSERQIRPKLPTVQIPKFDGDHGQWVTWKHSFESLVHSCPDLSNYIKHTQLLNSLTGTAANKISAFPPSEENYQKAWLALCESYDQKRIIVAEHIDAIHDLPVLTRTTPEGLSLLIDKTKQHLSMLREVGIELHEQHIIRILERRLPTGILARWHEKLDSNTLPSLDELYKFIQASVFRIRAIDRIAWGGRDTAMKRGAERTNQPLLKIKKAEGRSLVTSTQSPNSGECCKCGENHRLYHCPAFEKLKIPERWKLVKANGLCPNCLGNHKSECMSKFRCKKCSKDHHTLLHNDKTQNPRNAKNPQRGNESRVSAPTSSQA